MTSVGGLPVIDALQALGEGVGWYVDKGDVPAEGGGQRRGDVRVRDRRGASHGVGRAVMPGFGERGGGYRPRLEPPAWLRLPRNRRELRIHEHRSRSGLRDPASHIDSVITMPALFL